MRKIIYIILLFFTLISQQAFALMSAKKFVLVDNKQIRAIVKEYLIKNENRKLGNDSKIYIHTNAVPSEAKLEDKDYFINKNPNFKDSYMVVIIAGKEWCTKRGCYLLALSKNKVNEWKKSFSTISSGCYGVGDTIEQDKDGWFIGPYIADNFDARTRLSKNNKSKEVIHKGAKCQTPLKDLEKYYK